MAHISLTSRLLGSVVVCTLSICGSMAHGDSSLLYLEAQGVAGYSSELRKPVYYSMNSEAEMQKSSIGFDYLHRFAGESGDVAALGLQSRLALVVDDNGSKKLEPQVYNAWLKAKTPLADVWVGHNRPALGLGSYFDSHPLILRTLPIQGFGYDRDWGIGTYRDFDWGNLQLSATTGSGMPVLLKGNYLLAGRVAYGVLSEENYTVGFSAGYGQALDTMGYTLREPEPSLVRLVGTDFAWMRDNLEHRFDLFAGDWLDRKTVAAMYRLGMVLDPEGRLKIEAQPTYWHYGRENWLLSLCVTGMLTADLTLRTMYEFDRNNQDHRIFAQLYFYKPL